MQDVPQDLLSVSKPCNPSEDSGALGRVSDRVEAIEASGFLGLRGEFRRSLQERVRRAGFTHALGPVMNLLKKFQRGRAAHLSGCCDTSHALLKGTWSGWLWHATRPHSDKPQPR